MAVGSLNLFTSLHLYIFNLDEEFLSSECALHQTLKIKPLHFSALHLLISCQYKLDQ